MTLRSGLFWLAAACCVVAELAILRSLLFGSARRAERESTGIVAQTRRPVEIAWAILPAIGLMFVLYLTWLAVGSESNATIRAQSNQTRSAAVATRCVKMLLLDSDPNACDAVRRDVRSLT